MQTLSHYHAMFSVTLCISLYDLTLYFSEVFPTYLWLPSVVKAPVWELRSSKQSWWGGCARALLANRRNYPPVERRNDGEFVGHEFGPKRGLSGKDNFE